MTLSPGLISIRKGASAVIVWDINPVSIAKVKKEFEQEAKGVTQIFSAVVDVSDNARVREAYAEAVNQAGRVDIVVNCAGIVTSNKLFSDNTPEEVERTIRINTIAPMYVALAAIGDMVKRDSGHICNIASAAGMLSNPRMSAYAASKWGVIGWSDSVRVELSEMKSKVRITTIAPYYINTGMFDGFFGQVFGIYHTMDHFTGRKNS